MDRLAQKTDVAELLKAAPVSGAGLHDRPLPALVPAPDPPKPAPRFDWPKYWNEQMKENPPSFIVKNLLDENNRDVFPLAIRDIVQACRDAGRPDDFKRTAIS